jgi:hypothetical protein
MTVVINVLADLVPASSGFIPLSIAAISTLQKNMLRGFYAYMNKPSEIKYMQAREVFGRVIDQVRVLELRAYGGSNFYATFFVVVRMKSLQSGADDEVVMIVGDNYKVDYLYMHSAMAAVESIRDMGVLQAATVRVDLLKKYVKTLKPVQLIVKKKMHAFWELNAAGKQYLKIQPMADIGVIDSREVQGLLDHTEAWKVRAGLRVDAAVALAATVGH